MRAQSGRPALRTEAPEAPPMAQAFAQQALRTLYDEQRRTLYAISAAIELLDAGVLAPPEHDQLVQGLRRRVDYAVGIVAHAMELMEVGRGADPDRDRPGGAV